MNSCVCVKVFAVQSVELENKNELCDAQSNENEKNNNNKIGFNDKICKKITKKCVKFSDFDGYTEVK